jgi:chromosome partitioning protein
MQKGGVGKTTSAVNLSAALAEKGKKVLLIDIDPQGNATTGFGLDKITIEDEKETTYSVLLGDCSIGEAIIKDVIPNVSVIPSNINLSAAEIELSRFENREFILSKELEYVKDDYDFIIIDCPPSLNILTVNAMSTADTILVTIQCEYYALEGLSQLIHTINLAKSRLNPTLEMEGVVFTMYDARTNLSLEVVENVKKSLSQSGYKTIIPRNIRLAEAPSHGMPITKYDRRSTGSKAYLALADEIIEGGAS